jgi:hypothetical protein
MRVMWEADQWLMVRDIRDRMDYAPVGYTTVAKVTGILCEKDLLIRRLGDRTGKPGPSAWWYRAARLFWLRAHVGPPERNRHRTSRAFRRLRRERDAARSGHSEQAGVPGR